MNETIFLLALAAIFLIGAIGEVIFERTNIPDVVWLILAGIVMGPISGLITPGSLIGLAPYFAPITLVVVLFDGGSALKLGELRRAAPRSSILAVVSFVLSMGGIAAGTMAAKAAGFFPLSWTWTHGLLAGAILGGSSSIIIMPALAKANLPPALSNLINLESALTDALCVVSTVALIDVMATGQEDASAPFLALGKSFGIGLGVGIVAGFFWILFLKPLRNSAHAYPITISSLLLLYVGIDYLGGSAALGILTVAVILGNAPSLSETIGLAERAELKAELRGFHRQMTFIVKSFFFVFIGVMLGPPLSYIFVGVFLGGVLLATRVPAVMLSTIASGLSSPEKKLATVSIPRGMAAGVLATLPLAAGIPGTDQLPVAVFACVFTTIVIFAIGFPLLKRTIPTTLPVPEVVGKGAMALEPHAVAPVALSPQPVPAQPAGLAPAGPTLPSAGVSSPPPAPGGSTLPTPAFQIGPRAAAIGQSAPTVAAQYPAAGTYPAAPQPPEIGSADAGDDPGASGLDPDDPGQPTR